MSENRLIICTVSIAAILILLSLQNIVILCERIFIERFKNTGPSEFKF